MTSIRISDALKHVFENSTDAVFGKAKSVTDRLKRVKSQDGGRFWLEPVSLGVLPAWITLFSSLTDTHTHTHIHTYTQTALHTHMHIHTWLCVLTWPKINDRNLTWFLSLNIFKLTEWIGQNLVRLIFLCQNYNKKCILTTFTSYCYA